MSINGTNQTTSIRCIIKIQKMMEDDAKPDLQRAALEVCLELLEDDEIDKVELLETIWLISPKFFNSLSYVCRRFFRQRAAFLCMKNLLNSFAVSFAGSFPSVSWGHHKIESSVYTSVIEKWLEEKDSFDYGWKILLLASREYEMNQILTPRIVSLIRINRRRIKTAAAKDFLFRF